MWNEIKQTSFQFALGGIGGGIGVTSVYPIDLIKTNIQQSRTTISFIECYRNVISTSGYKGLFRGLKPQLLGVTPEKAIKLAVNDLIKRKFQQYPKFNNYKQCTSVVAGGLAGASQVIVTNPLEIVKIRLQLQPHTIPVTHTQPHGNFETLGALDITKKLGIRGLYKGSRACLMRDIPFSCIYFPLYSALKTSFCDDTKTTPPFYLFFSGTVAGAIASGITTPADVIKTRIQASDTLYTKNAISRCFKDIVRNEGATGLFKGIVPRILRSAPQFGITLFVYEMLQSKFES